MGQSLSENLIPLPNSVYFQICLVHYLGSNNLSFEWGAWIWIQCILFAHVRKGSSVFWDWLIHEQWLYNWIISLGSNLLHQWDQSTTQVWQTRVKMRPLHSVSTFTGLHFFKAEPSTEPPFWGQPAQYVALKLWQAS